MIEPTSMPNPTTKEIRPGIMLENIIKKPEIPSNKTPTGPKVLARIEKDKMFSSSVIIPLMFLTMAITNLIGAVIIKVVVTIPAIVRAIISLARNPFIDPDQSTYSPTKTLLE